MGYLPQFDERDRGSKPCLSHRTSQRGAFRLHLGVPHISVCGPSCYGAFTGHNYFTTKFQYTDGVSDVSRISPDNWVHDQALLDRPGNIDIQLEMLYDYRTNLPLYPAVQDYFRRYLPPTLIVWGKNDKIFPADGAYPYKRDLPDVEFHLIDTGHFALEDKADEMVPLIRDFLNRKIARQ
jgi:pimeloyl-ACP methyl ester carboxylesterase